MTTIDYEKYSNMSQRQLLNSLLNAEKQERKIKLQMQEKLAQKQKLIKFLKTKMKESLDKPKYEFIPYTQSESYKIAKAREANRTPQEQKTLEQEVNDLINKDYDDEL